MANSNSGEQIIGPLMLVTGEILDSRLVESPFRKRHTGHCPLTQHQRHPQPDGTCTKQTLRNTISPEAMLEFSHLDDVELPLLAVAERRGTELMRICVGFLEVRTRPRPL